MKAVYAENCSREEPLAVLWPALRSIALGISLVTHVAWWASHTGYEEKAPALLRLALSLEWLQTCDLSTPTQCAVSETFCLLLPTADLVINSVEATAVKVTAM
jgi:hypothetical protein